MHQRIDSSRPATPRRRVATPARLLGIAIAATMLGSLAGAGGSSAGASVHASSPRLAPANANATTPYPYGRWDTREPSHRAPPGPNALSGYTRVFVTDFRIWLTDRQWFLFRGVPSGDPAGLFEPSHVTIGGGVLKISTYKDPNYGNAWVSGGAGLYFIHPIYGAFFVRSRETGAGADDVQLLWPSNNQWPPEIDFDEMGVDPGSTTWTVHYINAHDQVQGTKQVNVLGWHTYGVIWTQSSIVFTVDGYAYGEVTAPYEIPNLPMALDLQMQSWCGISPECPTKTTSMLIDWVAIYEKSS